MIAAKTRSFLVPAWVIASVGLFGAGNGTFPASRAAAQEATRPAPRSIMVSGGVMAGNLLKRVAPVYPPDAKGARIQGIVVLQVMISATGEVTSATAISGPPSLRQSAVDSVKQWQYRPYLLNGQPVAVRSLVNVVYTLGAAPTGTGERAPAN